MANKIILKKSTVASKAPLATDLEVGELAVNTADAKLYTKHTDGSVKQLNTDAATILYDSNFRRIVNPEGATYQGAASVTGALAINLPVGMTNTMVRLTIKVYEHVTNESFEVHCGGYSYGTGNTWTNNPFAYIIGNPSVDRQFSVRFGYDTTTAKAVIYIGELTSVWAYPQVYVTEVQCGYSGQSSAWATGWSIGVEAAAFKSVTATVSNSQIGYAVSSNTANSTVLRDASGNFSAGTVTLSKTGIGTNLTLLKIQNTNGTANSAVTVDLDPTGTGLRGCQITSVTNGLNQTSLEFKTANADTPATRATLSPGGQLTVTGAVSAPTLESTVATGTAPFSVTSTTAVTNLNADLLDGKHASDFGRLVASTVIGDASNGNYWAKLATFSTGSNQYAEGQYLLAVTTSATTVQSTAIVSVLVRTHATNANPTVDISIIAKGGAGHIGDDSFKIISGGWASNFELWMQKKNAHGQFNVFLISSANTGTVSESWVTSATWQAAEPTGTVNNLKSNGFTYGGNKAWHAGNDGAGSGLDADTLDGQHGSYYLDWNNLSNKPANISELGISDVQTATRSTSTINTTANSWYRIAASALGIGRNSGEFIVDWTVTGQHGAARFSAGCHYGQVSGTSIMQENFSFYGTGGITEARIVYHTTYTGNYAYVEVKVASALTSLQINVELQDAIGWSLVTPATAGSVPAGYTSYTHTFVSAGGITAGTAAKITYNQEGRVTSGTSLAATDIPNLDAAKITSGTFASARMPAFSGDATSTAGATALTLATTGVTAATYGSSTSVPNITVDTKGRITSASNLAIQSASTTQSGIVQLSSATDSTSTTLAATASAVKSAYDVAAAAIPATAKGAANGVATLDANSKIPTSQLPSAGLYTHPTGDGNLHVPATGTTNANKFLTAGATAGSLSWVEPNLTHMPEVFIKDAVRLATTAELTATFLNNVLTNSGTAAALVVDGVTVALNDRILVKNQTTAAHNGIYIVTAVGASPSTAWTLTRSADANTATKIAGAVINVDAGTQGGILYTTDFKRNHVLNTNAVNWYRVVDTSLASNTAAYAAGTASAGTSLEYARMDHVHPLQDSVATLSTAQTFTIGGTSKSFNGSAGVSWTLTEIGAAASTHTHSASDINTGTLSTARLPVPASGNWFNGVPVISGGGVQEIGRYIDFHSTTSSTAGYTFRLDNSADSVLSASGSITVLGRLQSSGNQSITAWTTTGASLDSAAATFTDTSTAAAGTVATRVLNSFNTPTLASTNAITVTNAATVYIANRPTAGTNTTITNGYALWVDNGNCQFDGNVNVGGVITAAAGSVTAPSISFAADTNTGLYNTADKVFVTCGGVNAAYFGTTEQFNYGSVYVTTTDDAAADATTTIRDSSAFVLRGKYWNGTASASVDWSIVNGITAATAAGNQLVFRANGTDKMTLSNGGTLTVTDVNSTSDVRKKTNISTAAADVIQQLRGVEFEWKESGSKSSGVIAQEVEEVIPHAVQTDAEGFKSVNYSSLIAYLIESVKAQQKQINDLSMQVQQLQASK